MGSSIKSLIIRVKAERERDTELDGLWESQIFTRKSFVEIDDGSKKKTSFLLWWNPMTWIIIITTIIAIWWCMSERGSARLPCDMTKSSISWCMLHVNNGWAYTCVFVDVVVDTLRWFNHHSFIIYTWIFCNQLMCK